MAGTDVVALGRCHNRVVRRAGVSAVCRVVAAAAGTITVAASTTLVDGERDTTYAGAETSFAVIQVVAGVSLLVGGLMLLAARASAGLGALGVLAAVVWFAPVWVGWEEGPPTVRAVGLVVAPLLPAVVLAGAALIPPAGAGLARVGLLSLVALATLATALASTVLALVREPIRELYCWSDCTANAFVVRDDLLLTERARTAVLALGIACGVLAALIAAARLARAAPVTRRGSGPALAAAAVAGLAVAGYAAALRREPQENPERPLFEWLFVSRGLALVALGAGLAWIFLRPGLVRGRVTRLAVDLESSAAEGGLGRVLAHALGDPGLRLGYPVGESGRVVDADGRPLELAPGRDLTPIVGDLGVIALVESKGTSVDELERQLGPAAHLALGNERLRAETITRLGEVTASRARIVETADRARRRMERDLHDGAQQRLLALTYDLRVALTIAESRGNESASASLRVALDQAIAAAEELRDVAHGIFPAELTTSGLEAALESLADVRPLRLAVELPAGRRYPPDVETAAYAVIAEAGEHGGLLDVSVDEEDGVLRVTVEGEVEWAGASRTAGGPRRRRGRLGSRVRAARGGRTAGQRLTATCAKAVCPSTGRRPTSRPAGRGS